MTSRRVSAVVAGMFCLIVGMSAGAAQDAAPARGEQPAVSTRAAQQPLVSNIFVETFITQALQDIGLQAGVNILADSTVQGFVTLELKDVTLEEALEMVLAPGGYTSVKIEEGTYLVGKGDRTSPVFHVLTKTERLRLNYATADTVRKLLSEYYTPYVRFDTETNTAVVTAPPDLLARIKDDIIRIDQPAPQVVIEAIVTDVSEEARKQLGLDWSWLATPDAVQEREYGASFDSGRGAVSVRLRTPYDALLANLRRLADAGQAKVRANPRLTVLDGKSADIFVGEDRYFKIVTGSEATPFTRLEAINVGVTLSITPRIGEKGDITLLVKPTVSNVTGQVGDDLPVISRRQIATTVRVKDGETLVLGGLVQESEQVVESKIPILGDLPLLRYLFSSSREQSARSEVVVFITPRMLAAEG